MNQKHNEKQLASRPYTSMLRIGGVLALIILAACGATAATAPTAEPITRPPLDTPTVDMPPPATATLPPTDEPPTEDAAPAVEATSSFFSLNVVNALDRVICNLYLYRSSLDHYVGSLYELPPGESVELLAQGSDFYHFLATDCDDNVVYWGGINTFLDGMMQEVVVEEPVNTLRVVNSSSEPICTLSMVLTPTDAVGSDLINDGHAIPPGGVREFYVPFGGSALVRATTCGHISDLVTDDLTGEDEWTITD